jgi:HSP20 family protein
MNLINNNRPLPANFFRFFDDHVTKAADSHRPAVNISETDNGYILELLAPGRAKENFNIAFNEGTLEVTYTTPTAIENEATPVEPSFRRREFKLVDFTRRLKLDDKVIDTNSIDSSYL